MGRLTEAGRRLPALRNRSNTIVEFQSGENADDRVFRWHSMNDLYYAYGDETRTTLQFGRTTDSYYYASPVRFPSVTLQPGTTIINAHLSVCAFSGDPTNYAIQIENADNPTNITVPEDAYTAATTRVFFADVQAGEPSGWVQGTWYDSASIQTEIQAIVDRGGWASGNAISLVIGFGAGTFPSSTYRRLKAYPNADDGGIGTNGPKLIIEY